jgi:hypothetical protein
MFPNIQQDIKEKHSASIAVSLLLLLSSASLAISFDSNAFAQDNQTSTTAPTSSQQQSAGSAGGGGGGRGSNQSQQQQQQQGQQQQGQGNETTSSQQPTAGGGGAGQLAGTQRISGAITAAEGGEPFGGQQMGTVNIDTTGRRTIVSADINDTPEEGNVFEGWLVDTGGSGYKLSLGQFRNGTLDFSQYMVNPYTYNNFEVTEEPAEDADPIAADSIAGFELQDPFGQ